IPIFCPNDHCTARIVGGHNRSKLRGTLGDQCHPIKRPLWNSRPIEALRVYVVVPVPEIRPRYDYAPSPITNDHGGILPCAGCAHYDSIPSPLKGAGSVNKLGVDIRSRNGVAGVLPGDYRAPTPISRYRRGHGCRASHQGDSIRRPKRYATSIDALRINGTTAPLVLPCHDRSTRTIGHCNGELLV